MGPKLNIHLRKQVSQNLRAQNQHVEIRHIPDIHIANMHIPEIHNLGAHCRNQRPKFTISYKIPCLQLHKQKTYYMYQDVSMCNVGPRSSPLVKLHIGTVYFVLFTSFLQHKCNIQVSFTSTCTSCIYTQNHKLSGMDLILWVTPVVHQFDPFLFVHLRWRFFGQQLFSTQ